MAQLNLADIVKKAQAAEAAAPGFIDKAIAKIKAQEGSTIGDFILHHLGVTDPKAVEEEIIAGLTFAKSLLVEAPEFLDPFLSFLLSLQPAAPK